MQTSTQDIVSSTFLEIVEQLTFMFGERVDKDDLDLSGGEVSRASMSFTGDQQGWLAVVVPLPVMAEIAANILGLDEDEVDTEAMMPDATAEMLNVVCGHVIMAIAGSDANFDLHAPKIEAVNEEDVAAMVASDDYMGFELEDSPVLLGLHLES